MMEGSKWQLAGYGNVGKMERCLLGSTEIQVPEVFIEQKHLFTEVISQETWNKVLTEDQRRHLMTFLPKFPENDNEEKRESLRKLFKGENFKFGNPLQNFHYKLKEGSFSPDMVKYANMCRRIKMQDSKYRQQKYYSNLLKEILLSRQRVFDQLNELPPDEPIRFEYVPLKPKEKSQNTLETRVKKKYKRLLQEARQECGIDGTSSEEEEGSPVQRSKKQLFKSLNPVPSPEPVTPSVHSTYSSKPEYTNGDLDENPPPAKRPRPISPSEITEDTYRRMLMKHRRKQSFDDFDEEEHPEFNTQNITLQDVINRCQASHKGGSEPGDESELPLPSSIAKPKIKKEKGERHTQKKMARKICDMDNENIADDEDEDIKPNINEIDLEDTQRSASHFSFKTIKREPLGSFQSFFSLIKHFILNSPDHRISTAKLEEVVQEWQDSASFCLSSWSRLHEDWVEQVSSALKFLAGETIGMNIDSFIPFLDYKERAQQWHWIGSGRDSDEHLTPLSEHWIKHKEELADMNIDSGQGATPPSRSRTGYVVKATSMEEKTQFQFQEKARFEEPHKAYSYHLHGYESVVGPVKGVYSKKNDMTKAREHALLIPDRPAFVTILTLVRDAVARLPNGEGTRGDICELLKDSQFLATGITDAQINVVVSGALDRLHSEKDPCVKYDVNRKVWIYLHRSRTEEEFEKIHQAQAAALKAKKSLNKPKATKAVSKAPPVPSVVTSAASMPSMVKVPSAVNSSSENINVEELSPQSVTQAQLLANPALQTSSPSPVTASPRQATQALPKPSRQTSGSGRNLGVTQSLTPAQLKLLQQAAAAQAEAEAAKAKAHAQAQAQAQATALAKAHAKASAAGVLTSQGDITTTLQKNITLSQGTLKVIPQPTTLTPGIKTAPPPNVTIQRQSDMQLQRQLSASSQSQTQGSPSNVSLVTKTVTMAVSSASTPVTAVSMSQSGNTSPLVARLVQQMSGGQMVSVSNLLAAQRSLQQGNQQRQTAFKLQGGNVVHKVAGGKPLQLAGKPLAHAKGQLIQLGGKGQQTLGLIQTPQGTINIIPQTVSSGGMVTLSQHKAEAGTNSPTATPSVSTNQLKVTQSVNQSKGSPSNPGNVVLTQFTPGNITLRPGVGVGQGKVLTQGHHPGLVPTQFVLQQSPGVKSAETQSPSTSTGTTSILVSGVTGNQSQNLQMVRTVLSQQAGLKPGQATILISQPTLQQAGQVLPPGQVIQGTRAPGKTPQGKQPMYARIITPPSNLNVKLAGLQTHGGGIIQTVSTAQTGSVQNEAAVLQTVNKILAASGTATVTSGTSPIATSQQILAAAAAGKAAHIKEMEQDKNK